MRSEALTRWREAASKLGIEENRLLAVISDAFPSRENLQRHFAFDIRTFQIAMPEALPTRQLVNGLEQLRSTAAEMAQQDTTTIVDSFGQLGPPPLPDGGVSSA